jgi:hypothetical protein
MELESELRGLAAEIAWPQTPALRPDLAPRPLLVPRHRFVALAAAVVAVALGAAFAVPQSRGAILRFLGLGAVRVQFVDRLPAAQERPLTAMLGRTVSAAGARNLLGSPPLQPPLSPAPPLHMRDGILSLVFLHRGEPVLLGEIGSRGTDLLKKVAQTGTTYEWKRVGNDPAIWITGDQHVVVFPHAVPRLAGNVLIWERGNLTLRLEGRHLTLGDALKLAGKIG